MASSPTDLPFHTFNAADGQQIAWRELGEGTPVLLLHGLFSSAFTNWIRYGHAQRIAAAGFRVIMPDLRAHGHSAHPHDPAAYPPDVLADDAEALVRHLGLTGYHLGGYSLGARTVVRMLVRGAAPESVVLAGMGLEGLLDTGGRARHFRHVLSNLGTHPQGSPEWMAEAFLKTTRADPQALLLLLDSFVDTDRAALDGLDRPTLVLSGAEDADNGSAAALAERLPQAAYAEVPGGHMSAVTRGELGEAMARFLADRAGLSSS